MAEKTNTRPGIEALEVYFPSLYVDQQDLEKFDGVSSGKYTIGLGQSQQAFCDDNENVHSLALTVVSNLMSKVDLSYADIGRLTVSSETILDKSKSIKSVIMQLFEDSGNHDVEGVDYLNACYGGTAGFFDAIQWVQSEDWDGRRAIVVAVDIAEYAPGPARPTGGAGAVAMLIGPEAVISLEPGRASFMKHTYDFYKPYLSSPFPVVDGQLSNECYLEAVDECYQSLVQKRKRRSGADTHLGEWDYFLFHSPYNKLVQKSFGRLMYNDFLLHPKKPEYAEMQDFLELDRKSTYSHRGVYKAFAKASKPQYKEKVGPSTMLPKAIGNCYTASMYVALASLIHEQTPEDLTDKSVLSFSYGSGLCSSIFQLRFCNDVGKITELKQKVDYSRRLSQRIVVSPETFSSILDKKGEQLRLETEAFAPQDPLANLTTGTFFVKQRTEKGIHMYEKFTDDAVMTEACGLI